MCVAAKRQRGYAESEQKVQEEDIAWSRKRAQNLDMEEALFSGIMDLDCRKMCASYYDLCTSLVTSLSFVDLKPIMVSSVDLESDTLLSHPGKKTECRTVPACCIPK